MTDSLALALVLAAAALVRLLLWQAGVDEIINDEVEIVTPVTCFAGLVEGRWLSEHGMSPYEGDAVHHSPLLVAAYGALASIHPVVVDCAWVGADLLAGYALARAAVLHARLMHSHDQAAAVKKSLLAHVGFPAAPALAPALVAALYVLHPYTVATCVARSTATFTNLAVLGAFCAALKGNAGLSTLLVAVGTCLALYPALLLVPVVMIHAHTRGQAAGVVGLYIAWVAALGYLSFLYEHSHRWLHAVHVFTLTVPDLTPNVGVYWYFFLEIFDHFRGFYLCVFHLHMAAYLPPLAIRLRDTPTLLYTVLGILIAAFKTYPSFADAALAHALLPLWAPLYAYARVPFAMVIGYVVSTGLLPVMRHLWLYAASGNANFFYALTIVYTAAHVAAAVDLLQAHGRRQHDLAKGLAVADPKDDVMLR